MSAKIWIENGKLMIRHGFDNFLNEKYRQLYFIWNPIAKQREKDLKKIDIRAIAFLKSLLKNTKHNFEVTPEVLKFIDDKMGGEAETPGPGFGEIEKKKEIDLNIDLSFMKMKPFDYQKHGIAFMNANDGVIMLGDEMGVGKCIIKSRVYTDYGYPKIEELFNSHAALESKTVDKEGGEWFDLSKKAKVYSLSENGKIVKKAIVKIYREKINNEIKLVELNDGSQIECTKAHRLLTLQGWSNEFKEKEYLQLPRKVDFKGNDVDLDLVYFFAWLVSEGSEQISGNRIRITQNDVGVLNEIKRRIERYASLKNININSVPIFKDSRNKTHRLDMTSVDLCDHLKKIDYDFGHKSATKKIPDFIMNASKEAVQLFLSNYFEAEGCISKNGNYIEISSASKEIIEQLSILLRRFGIWLRYTPKQKMATNGKRIKRTYFNGIIGGTSLREFQKHVRFTSDRKNALLDQLTTKKLNDNVDIVPTLDVCKEINEMGIPQHHTGISNVYKTTQNLSRTTLEEVISNLDKILSGETQTKYKQVPRSKWTDQTNSLYHELDYKRLQQLRDTLKYRLDQNVFYAQIKKITLKPHNDYVYDISVEDNHNYIANGMWSHNTLQVISYTTLNKYFTVIVCPASLKYKWKSEVAKFTNRTAAVLSEFKPEDLDPKKKLADYVIINYEQLEKYENYLSKAKFECVALDESHYIINLQAKRTKMVFKLFKKIKHRICISGTPIKNRPIDFYPQLKFLRPDVFSNKMDYGLKFCAAKETPFGWDLKGASNLDELHKRIAPFYIRRTKKEVLKDLPEKTVSLVEIEMNDKEGIEYGELQDDFFEILKSRKNDPMNVSDLGKMVKMRQYCSKAKIDRVVEFVDQFLASSEDRKIVIFSQFIETQKLLKEKFKGRAVSLLGEDNALKREQAVQSFQNDPKVRVFIGSTIAAGVGIDLFAGDTAVFVDLLWSPSDLQQAEDRLLRIGQKNAVSIYYFSFKDSIESMIWGVIGKKLTVINEVLEGKKDAQNTFNAERQIFNQFLSKLQK